MTQNILHETSTGFINWADLHVPPLAFLLSFFYASSFSQLCDSLLLFVLEDETCNILPLPMLVPSVDKAVRPIKRQYIFSSGPWPLSFGSLAVWLCLLGPLVGGPPPPDGWPFRFQSPRTSVLGRDPHGWLPLWPTFLAFSVKMFFAELGPLFFFPQLPYLNPLPEERALFLRSFFLFRPGLDRDCVVCRCFFLSRDEQVHCAIWS